MKKVLILPFAHPAAESNQDDHYLTRQLPILVRNAFEKSIPGRVVAVPLATTTGERRVWVVNSQKWTDDAAVVFASERGYDIVAVGDFERTESAHVYSAHFRGVAVSDARVLFDKTFTGDVLTIGRAMIGILAPELDIETRQATALFAPDTKSAEAYEFYMRGLDVLLTLRSDDMRLDAPERAMQPFADAVDVDPKFGDALTAGMSCALQAMEKNGRALSMEAILGVLAEWIERFPADARLYAVATELLLSKKMLVEALAVVQKGLVAVNPAPRDLVRRTADILVDLGRNAEALEHYRRAEEMQHDRLVVERMATLCVMLQREEEARAHMERVLVDDPERTDMLVRLALLEMRAGLDDSLWRRLEAVFSTHNGPTEADLAKINGILVQKRAPDTFRRVLRSFFPPESFTINGRILLVRSLRLAGAALEARLGAERLAKQNLSPEARSNLAREKLNLTLSGFDDRFAEAAKASVAEAGEPDLGFIEQAICEEPDFWPARFLRGLTTARRGDLERALADFSFVLDKQPKNDIVWYTKGLYLMKLGRHVEAVEHFETAIGINSKDGDYHLHLAISQAHLHQADKARASLARAQELRPNHPENGRIGKEVERVLG